MLTGDAGTSGSFILIYGFLPLASISKTSLLFYLLVLLKEVLYF